MKEVLPPISQFSSDIKDNLKSVLSVSFLIIPIVHRRRDKRAYYENSHLVSDQNQFQLLVAFPVAASARGALHQTCGWGKATAG